MSQAQAPQKYCLCQVCAVDSNVLVSKSGKEERLRQKTKLHLQFLQVRSEKH